LKHVAPIYYQLDKWQKKGDGCMVQPSPISGAFAENYFVSSAFFAQHFFSVDWLVQALLAPPFALVLTFSPAVLLAQQPVFSVVQAFFFFLPPFSPLTTVTAALSVETVANTAEVPTIMVRERASVKAIFLYITVLIND
jgi:hypothetical protein